MGRLFAPKPKAEETPAEAPPAPPPASTVSKEELQTLLSGALEGVAGQLAGAVQQLNTRLEELASRQPQVYVQPAPPASPAQVDTSDADIDAAVLSGQGAAQHIRRMVDRAVNKATQQVLDQHVKPLQDYGVNTISELSRRVTMGNMPRYNKYKKEIDEKLNLLSPDVRANPTVIETVYNAVVGSHSDEEIKEAVEAAVRQAQETPPPATPAPSASRSATPGTGAGPGATRDTSGDLPDVQTYLGSDASEGLDALKNKGTGGQSADDFARGLGYADWATYMKQYNELLSSETKGNA